MNPHTSESPTFRSLSEAKQIHHICSAFEAEWNDGRRPSLDEYFLRISAESQETLLCELLLCELEQRVRRGETPQALEYQSRFPQHTEAIALAFEQFDELMAELGSATEIGFASCAEVQTEINDNRPQPRTGSDGSAPPMPSFNEGKQRYKLDEWIASGGIGHVFRARDTDLGCPVALKVLREEHSGDSAMRERFMEEARVTSQLQHPGVAPVYERGRTYDERPYFTMKWVDGRTFAEILKEGAERSAELTRLLNIYEQVCRTLAHAHACGVIHRDLKPSNIMVGPFGEVHVMDWGLAKRMKGEGGRMNEDSKRIHPSPFILHPSETQPGVAMGTPAYMPPEQARGLVRDIDKRADVFALGAILCEIVTGQPPYRGKSINEIHGKAARGELGEAFANLDQCNAAAELIQLARQCLARTPADRPLNAGILVERLAAYFTGVQERLQHAELARAKAEAKAAEEGKRRRVWLAFAGVLLALVIGVCGVGVWYSQYRAARLARQAQVNKEMNAALVEGEQAQHQLREILRNATTASRLLSDPTPWKNSVKSIRGSWQRATVIRDGNPDLIDRKLSSRLQELGSLVQMDEEHLATALKLDDIRLTAASQSGHKKYLIHVFPKYLKILKEQGFDVVREQSLDIAARIRQSPLRFSLVAALDFLASSFAPANGETLPPKQTELRNRLLTIAKLADPDPWRDKLRDPELVNKTDELQRLAGSIDPGKQTPQNLFLLGRQLYLAQRDASPFLRSALAHHADDFWLHVLLGLVTKDKRERVGCYRAALAARPDSAGAHVNLALALQDLGNVGLAESHLQRAISLDANNGVAHLNLGKLYLGQRKLAKATDHFQKCLLVDSNNADAYFGQGFVYFHKAMNGNRPPDEKSLAKAASQFERVIEIEPNYPQGRQALNNVHQLLRERRKATSKIR